MPNYKLSAVCDVSVTNVCNAACDFCGFARDKTLVGAARYLNAEAFCRALPILHRRGIRYLTLQGGERLVHPDIVCVVSQTVAAGISCATLPMAGQIGPAVSSLFRRSVAQSLWALIEDTPKMRRLARRRKRTAAKNGVLYDGSPSDERTRA